MFKMEVVIFLLVSMQVKEIPVEVIMLFSSLCR